MRPHLWHRVLTSAVLAAACGGLAWAVHVEIHASPVQSRVFTEITRRFAYDVEEGPSERVRFPAKGPYDERLGYTRLPDFLASLDSAGFVIDRQARLSPTLARFIDLGGFATYREKAQSGLTLLDRKGNDIYLARHPERAFASFDAIPRLIVDTLLFVENRELLDTPVATRNPAVEWDRFAAASFHIITDAVASTGNRFGGSTLATQIEKYRHSPEGRTGSIGEKVRQIASASARAYQDGADTTEARRRIVLDYVNSTPLSARPGFGEIIGLGDGLFAWYDIPFEHVVEVLADPDPGPETLAERAATYKHVLSLLLAQRRPSYYLLDGRDDLLALTDRYLRLLTDAGVIDRELYQAALAQPLQFRREQPPPADGSFVDRKAINAIRAHLLGLLGESRFYALDRLELRAQATLDAEAQRAVTQTLRRLMTPEGAAAAGLIGDRLLQRGHPAGVAYSVTLFERVGDANVVRVQADNLERPFDINEGGKFDLGSTAKLRTLITYLEIVATLHQRLAGLDRPALQRAAAEARDPLTRWAADHLARTADKSLQTMVDAAMERKYSGHAGEGFFTGRGMHYFANFDRSSGGVMSVSQAFRHSVNLVFIRMMRDIVRFYQADGVEPAKAVLEDPQHPARQAYLQRFADMEGTLFLDQFYKRYAKLSADDALNQLASRTHPTPQRLAAVFRSVRPEASLAEFTTFLRRHLPQAKLDTADLARLYDGYGPDRFNLHDRGYIARRHPLELWLVGYLQEHPQAPRSAVVAASQEERQEVYAWLFKSKRKRAADSRIRIIQEQEAFERVLAAWQRVGYPFTSIVPSLATAIGSSADRPAALAELIGIIVNDGVRLPTQRIDRLRFAEETPFETHLRPAVAAGERVFPREVAVAARGALADVVANGTAKRVGGAFVDSHGKPLPVGGKTGTGDELADRFGPGTAAGKQKEVSRSAAFAFFIGDRFFGVITAHVPGPNARQYKFTSALPTQVLRALAPALKPLVNGVPEPAVSRARGPDTASRSIVATAARSMP